MSLPPPDDYIGEPGYPAPWTTSRPREALRDNDEARIVSLAPDVCRSPKKPVPYMIYDTCGHDANYTPSVRFTGQKAMVLRSNTTHVHGDEPGVGKGVKSGTVGGISEPIGHAAQVRAEGSPVIRHLDRFHMNNRNTVGEAIFLRDTATYPAPENDDPVPGSLVLAAATGAPATSFAPPTQTPPPQTPPTQTPPTQTPPTRPPPPPAPRPDPRRLLRRHILGELAYQVIEAGRRENARARNDPEGYMAREAERYGGVEGLNDAQRDIHDRAVERLRDGAAQGHVREDYDREMHRERTERERRELLGDTATQTETETGTRVDDEGSQRECKVGPFEEIKPICNGETHHIVPDMVYRLGRRPRTAAEKNSTEDRINQGNAPTFNQGMSICLRADQHTSDPEGLHGQLRAAFSEIGAEPRSPVGGTAPMQEILAASLAQIIAIDDLPDECKVLAAARTTLQVDTTVGRDAPGRTKEAPLPSGKARSVLWEGHY